MVNSGERDKRVNGEHREGESPKLLGVRAFARLKGWSPSYVCKLIKQGRLVLRDNQIDVRASNELLAESIIPMHRGRPKDSRSLASKDGKAAQSPPVTFLEARTKREWHEAQLAELRHRKLLASLVDAEDVRCESFACVWAVRDALLALPDRLSPVIAAEGNAWKIHEILNAEIEQTLNGLATEFERQAAASASFAEGIEPQ